MTKANQSDKSYSGSIEPRNHKSGKSHDNENFPVASILLRAEHRPVILAFYDFARAADDIADDPELNPQDKVARLDRMEAGLVGEDSSADNVTAVALRTTLKARGLTSRHAQDLLVAFRTDATKLRYADWNDLMSYCAYSAAPVGRFVLDVHGEPPSTWAASDAICSALQIINHLQDCADDYRKLDRVYLPLDALAANGVGANSLSAPKASEGLRQCIVEVAGKTQSLLREGASLAGNLKDRRLRLEIAVIQALAERFLERLLVMDPVSERTKLSRLSMGGIALGAIVRTTIFGSRLAPPAALLESRP